MIKTDPLTGFLAHKFVSQEEEKDLNKMLYSALQRVIANCPFEGVPEEELVAGLPPAAIKTAASIIRERAVDQITKAVEHLADTLALARDMHKEPTAGKLKKLKKMAHKAAEDQEPILALINGAVDLIDFDYIAETLVEVGKRRAEAATTAEAL